MITNPAGRLADLRSCSNPAGRLADSIPLKKLQNPLKVEDDEKRHLENGDSDSHQHSYGYRHLARRIELHVNHVNNVIYYRSTLIIYRWGGLFFHSLFIFSFTFYFPFIHEKRKMRESRKKIIRYLLVFPFFITFALNLKT